MHSQVHSYRLELVDVLSGYQYHQSTTTTTRLRLRPRHPPSSIPLLSSSQHHQTPTKLHFISSIVKPRAQTTTTMASENFQEEILPPVLDSTSDPPSLFDGTTRLYTSLMCPYAQRVWITRNCKGLQEEIKLVPIDLQNRPGWYKEKVYPANKVPALEHKNKIIGESLDLIKYLDSHFEGPSLYPSNDPSKSEFAEELLSYTSNFNTCVMTSIKGDAVGGSDIGDPFDYLETALAKFNEGPFFLGEFSLVDIAYAPFIERYQPLLLELKGYDITQGRPKLAGWIEQVNKIEAYTQTKRDPKELVAIYKKRLLPKSD